MRFAVRGGAGKAVAMRGNPPIDGLLHGPHAGDTVDASAAAWSRSPPRPPRWPPRPRHTPRRKSPTTAPIPAGGRPEHPGARPRRRSATARSSGPRSGSASAGDPGTACTSRMRRRRTGLRTCLHCPPTSPWREVGYRLARRCHRAHPQRGFPGVERRAVNSRIGHLPRSGRWGRTTAIWESASARTDAVARSGSLARTALPALISRGGQLGGPVVMTPPVGRGIGDDAVRGGPPSPNSVVRNVLWAARIRR